jgi:hypothetical protein
MGEGFGRQSFNPESFDPESFDPELTTEGLTTEGLTTEWLGRTVWVGVITLPLIPSRQGRGNELLDSLISSF